MVLYGIKLCEVVWHGKVWYGMTYGVVCPILSCHVMTWHGIVMACMI